MTVSDFDIGDTWINGRGRRLEIVAVDEVETDAMPHAEVVIAYRFHGLGMVHLRAAAQTTDWHREVE